jgi:hypothetical protein
MNIKAKNNILKLRLPEFSGEWEEKGLGNILKIINNHIALRRLS